MESLGYTLPTKEQLVAAGRLAGSVQSANFDQMFPSGTVGTLPVPQVPVPMVPVPGA